eukprot:704396-Amphidinium_carterae.1
MMRHTGGWADAICMVGGGGTGAEGHSREADPQAFAGGSGADCGALGWAGCRDRRLCLASAASAPRWSSIAVCPVPRMIGPACCLESRPALLLYSERSVDVNSANGPYSALAGVYVGKMPLALLETNSHQLEQD